MSKCFARWNMNCAKQNAEITLNDDMANDNGLEIPRFSVLSFVKICNFYYLAVVISCSRSESNTRKCCKEVVNDLECYALF